MMASFFCVLTALALAGDPSHPMPSHEGSKELQKIKALEGTWSGTSVMGEMTHDASVIYAVTAAGSAVVETLHPGSPMEMVSVYHDTDGGLAMTHYCALGNQPYMVQSDSTKNSITLTLSKDAAIDVGTEEHMHGVTMKFIGKDKLEATWIHYKDGAEAGEVKATLTRQE
jgi:hypothetical protein